MEHVAVDIEKGGGELWKNIETLYEFDIINKTEKERLRLLKNEYRNPFSHASNNSALKEGKTLISEISLSEVSKLNCKEIPTRKVRVTGNPYLLINARMDVLKDNALGYFCEIISFLKMFDDKLTKMRKSNHS